MKLTIDLRWPRFLHGRHRRVAAIAVVAFFAVGVPLALASHDYTDVLDANPFHSDIAAVKRAGITGGKTCEPPGTPPTYCPSESITREAMAAFVHRGFGRAAPSTTNEVAIPDGGADLGSLSIDVGGVAGQTQFVKLDAAVTSYISSGTGCPCETSFGIVQDGVGLVSVVHYLVNDNDAITPGGFADASGAATAVVSVPTGTTQTFRVIAARSDPTPSLGSVTGYAALTAVTASFGHSGTDALATSKAIGPRASGKGLGGKLTP